MNKSPPRRHRRGIYLLPNLLTTAALFCGFYGVTAAVGERYEIAAIVILLAMILDGLDGRVARLTNTQSEFGAQYDSMADMASFGISPALIIYLWSLESLGKLGLFAAFVYAAGAALRLARFNTQLETADRRYFQGLPSPAGAAVLASYIWVATEYGFFGKNLQYTSILLTIVIGLLMVSNFRYYSFKDIDLRGKVSFVVATSVMLSFGLVFAHPPVMLFVFFFLYAFSGPTLTLIARYRRRKKGLSV